ncbi:hypothetical protein DPMN_134793 [Dreissena polymorpha]|uniref:Uncharacterized protein n=1 Tax=Dreissena polymorpha TaxID=45954 RepID=A0A9D4G0K2_DREPO|nr:hypothetical protein DPMN_134793 [Dreissena polymorpha]
MINTCLVLFSKFPTPTAAKREKIPHDRPHRMIPADASDCRTTIAVLPLSEIPVFNVSMGHNKYLVTTITRFLRNLGFIYCRNKRNEARQEQEIQELRIENEKLKREKDDALTR